MYSRNVNRESKMAAYRVFMCLRCDYFQALSLRNLLNHYRFAHSNEAFFSVKCNVDQCPAISTLFNSLYSHVIRKHKNIYQAEGPLPLPAQDPTATQYENDGSSDLSDDPDDHNMEINCYNDSENSNSDNESSCDDDDDDDVDDDDSNVDHDDTNEIGNFPDIQVSSNSISIFLDR